MKRILMVLALAIGLAVPAYAGSIAAAGPASAAVCTDWTTGYAIKDKVRVLEATSLHGDWLHPNAGKSLTMQYTETGSYTNNASVTTTVTAEAGLIFSKVSASVGVTVGRSWSQSKAWSYSLTVEYNPAYWYRLHLYHVAWTFKVMKFNSRVCNGQVQRQNVWASWQPVYHAPVKSSNGNVWQVDKKHV